MNTKLLNFLVQNFKEKRLIFKEAGGGERPDAGSDAPAEKRPSGSAERAAAADEVADGLDEDPLEGVTIPDEEPQFNDNPPEIYEYSGDPKNPALNDLRREPAEGTIGHIYEIWNDTEWVRVIPVWAQVEPAAAPAAPAPAAEGEPDDYHSTLTPAQADQLLADFEGDSLFLNRLTTLDAATAKKLAASKGEKLYLDGLTSLDAATAGKLAAFKGWLLDLSGLTSLDAATAGKLAAYKGEHLGLSGLTSLDAATAKKLAAYKGEYLDLSGLTSLDAATAEKLAAFKGEELDLSGLTSLDAATAKALKQFETEFKMLSVSSTVRQILDTAE